MQDGDNSIETRQIGQEQSQLYNSGINLDTGGERVLPQQQELQQSNEVMSAEEKELSDFREKEMARMNAGLEKLGKKGHITIEDFTYNCVVYDGGEGWEEKEFIGCKFEGIIDGNRIEADTDQGRKPKEGWVGVPELRINGEVQDSSLFRDFLETYAPFAYNIKKEKEIIGKLEIRQLSENLGKEKRESEEERKRKIEKARKILF
jgi:hypothetical protein